MSIFLPRQALYKKFHPQRDLNLCHYVHYNTLQTLVRFISTNKMAKEFPPEKVRAIVTEVATLLKEKKETVSVAETVCCILLQFLSKNLLARLQSHVLPSFVSVSGDGRQRYSIWKQFDFLSKNSSFQLSELSEPLLTRSNAGSRWNHFSISPQHAGSKRLLQRRFDCMFASSLLRDLRKD